VTRKQLLTAFPLPWRAERDDSGVVRDARGAAVLTVDQDRAHADDAVVALAELVADLVNGTKA